MKRRSKSDCPVCYALDIFGDKWTLLIVRDMLAFNKRTYREFLQSGEGVATNILADRLKRLVEIGIATKEVDPDNRTQALYRPTAKAEALSPMLRFLVDWGMAYGPADLRSPYDEADAKRRRAASAAKAPA